MRRSKLERYIDILEVLATRGPLKITHIMYKSNVNCNVLNGQLEFLIGNQLVEERVQKKERVFYAITQKGLSVLKSFREIRQIFPEEEERKVPTLY